MVILLHSKLLLKLCLAAVITEYGSEVKKGMDTIWNDGELPRQPASQRTVAKKFRSTKRLIDRLQVGGCVAVWLCSCMLL